MSDTETTTVKQFPYKTLIWAALALIAMFLFKTEFKGLLSKADEVSLFGIELKVGKEKAAELERAINKYKNEIASINDEMLEQQQHIRKLEVLKQGLEEDVANCPQAAEKALLWTKELDIIQNSNMKLQQSSERLKDKQILQKMNVTPRVMEN